MAALAIPAHASRSVAATDGVRTVLRLEGLALLIVAAALYARSGAPWMQAAILFLAPDLSFIGYIAGARIGALFYNAAHSTLGPLALAGFGLAFAQPLTLSIALIWLGHVGFDRALGYGLKHATGFADTHLGAIGKKRMASSE